MHHRCCWHWWQMEKIFNHKSLNYLVWTPLGRRINLKIHFCLQVHFKVSAAWYCSLYLPPVSTTLAKMVVNLPLVLLIPVANLPPVSLTPVANLSAVLLIPVVHLDLRISPRIFEKIWNGPNGILWDWGKLIHEKNQKQKILWHCPLTRQQKNFKTISTYTELRKYRYWLDF